MFKRIFNFIRDVIKEFLEGRCSLHAAGLTYYSLLAFIPILCLLLTLAKTLGADDYARGFINRQIDALIENVEKGGDDMPKFISMPGMTEEKIAERRRCARDFADQARTISNTLFDRIDKFSLKTFGWIGLAGLLLTVVFTLATIEDSMNNIWEVKKPRSWFKRVSLYILISTVLPILAAVALSMPVLHVVKSALDATVGATAYTKWIGDALLAVITSKLFGFCLSFLFATLAFAFALGFMPNTRVNRIAALEGGCVTAVSMCLWLKICAWMQVGIANANALYGSFAFLPILLAWMYFSWRIFLFGSVLTYAFHRHHTASRPVVPES